MAKSFATVKAEAVVIRDEVITNANTATRVGTAMLDTLDTAEAEINAAANLKINISDVVNTLDSTSTEFPLSANQGKVLNEEKVDKTQSVIAGNGLIDGGQLNGDVTLNVAATDDSIVVGANGIKTNTVDALNSTSETKPLSANQGRVLNSALADIEGEVSELELEVTTVSTSQSYVLSQSRNIYSIEYNSVDYGVDNLGIISSSYGWIGTKLPVTANTKYSICNGSNVYWSGQIGALVYLNSSSDVISYVNMDLLPIAYLKGRYFTTPANCAFIIFNSKVGVYDFINNIQVELGTVSTEYVTPKKIADSQFLPLNDIFLQKKDIGYRNTTNLFVNTIIPNEIGYYVLDNGIIVYLPTDMALYYGLQDWANTILDKTGAIGKWTMSGSEKYCRIKIKGNTRYSFNFLGTSWASGIRIELEGGQYYYGLVIKSDAEAKGCTLTGYEPEPITGGYSFLSPPNAEWFMINLNLPGYITGDKTETFLFVEGDSLPAYSAGVCEIEKINSIPISDQKLPALSARVSALENASFPLNVTFLGDSITSEALLAERRWLSYLNERITFTSVQNLARSGATWSHTVDTVYDIISSDGSTTPDNVIWNQYNRLLAGITDGNMVTPDLIVILAGVNDLGRTVGVPSTVFTSGSTVLDKNANTILDICSAVRFVVENILVSFPLCQIIIATPMQKGVADNSSIFNIGDKMEECCKYLSVKCIRQDKGIGIYGFNEINADIFQYDGLHPNATGAIKIAKFMASELRKIIEL